MSVLAGLLLGVTLAGAAPADSLARPDSLAAGAMPDTLADASTLTVERATLAAGALAEAGMRDMTGLAVDTFGRIYVCDAALHRLLRLDRNGKPNAEFGSLGTDPTQLQRPGGVALLGTFGIAVLDRDNRRVVTLDLFGRLLGTLIDLGSDDLERRIGRSDATAIASDRGGALALLDRERDRVLMFDFSGRFVREVGGFGTAPGSFRGLRGVTTTPRGELVCADRGNARIQRLDAGGRVAASWAIAVAPGAGALPVAVDGDGRIAMADEDTGRLWLWAADGTPLHASEGYVHPRALAFTPDGALLMAESAPARLLRLVFAVPGPPRER